MNLSDNEILKLILVEREWQTFECKRANIKPSDLLITVVAFANSDGGRIALGLEDPKKASNDRRLFGINENTDNVSDFLNLLTRNINPSLIAFSKYEFPIKNISGCSGYIYIINIKKSKDVHSLYNGDTYVRKGEHNVKIGATEIIRLKYEKGSIEYENELTRVDTLEDIDLDLLSKYKIDKQSESLDNWQFLEDNGLAKSIDGKFYLSKGGILLFAKNPAILLSTKCSIKITHYFGNEPTYSGEPNLVSRPLTMEGPLIK